MTLRDEIEDPTRRLGFRVSVADVVLYPYRAELTLGVPGVLGFSVKKSIANPVPVASIRINRIHGWITIGKNMLVSIRIGYNGRETTIFQGSVQDRAPGDTDGIIHAAGKSFALWRTVQIPEQVFGAITTEEAIIQVVDYATDQGLVLNIPETLTVDPDNLTTYYTLHETAALDRATSAQMIQKIADIEHWAIWENNVGHLIFKDKFVPGEVAFRAFSTGSAATAWIIGQRSSEDPTALKTRLTVLGGTITSGTPPDETTHTPEKTASVTAASLGSLVELPEGSFIDAEYSNSLIHDDDRAADLASVRLKDVNFVPRRAMLRTPGDPELDIGQTIDLNYPEKNLVAKFYIYGIEHRVDKSGYVTILDLRGGEGSNVEVGIIPTAGFDVKIDRETYQDGLYIFATFNASSPLSYAEDGGTLTYDWSDNQGAITTPDINSETAEIVTVRLKASDLVGDWIVSLIVTDTNGLVSNKVDVTVDTTPSGTAVQIPSVYAAIDIRQTATPDGGQNWYDRTDVDVVSVTARPPDGLKSGIAVYGQSDGTIMKTTDFCATALVEVKPAAGGNPKIWDMLWDYRNLDVVWAIDEDMRVYKSASEGDGWSLYDDLSSVFSSLPAGATIRHIGLPAAGGIWVYGGTGIGNPLIAYDRNVDDHNWTLISRFGGELFADLPAASNDYRIVDAVDMGAGLMIVFENADAGDSGARPIYFNPNVFDSSGWLRATGLSAGFTNAAYVVPDPIPKVFYVGEKGSRSSWRKTDPLTMAFVENTDVFPANVSPHHAIWIPNFVHNLNTANVYLIACEDSSAQASGLYKSADGLQTVQPIRPVTSFSTWPSGSIGRKIAAGSPSVVAAIGTADHLMRVDISGSDLVHTELNDSAWTPEIVVKSGGGNSTPRPYVITNDVRFIVDRDGADLDPDDWGLGYRTKDAGATWAATPTPPGLSGRDFGISTYACDINGRIWMALGEAGIDNAGYTITKVFYSDTDGDSWIGPVLTLGNGLSPPAETYHPWKILPHPTHVNRIVFLLKSTNFPHSGSHGLVTVSEDRGATWSTPIDSHVFNEGQVSVSQYYDQLLLPNDRIVTIGPYQSASGYHYMHSDDFGASWVDTLIVAGVGNHRILGLYHNLSYSKLAFILQQINVSPNEANLYLSYDQGATFTNTPLNGNEWEDEVWASDELFENFAFSADRDAMYLSGSGAVRNVVRLSPVSVDGKWVNLNLNDPLGTTQEGNMISLP